MKIVATIEARMNSSRLPGKVMLRSQGKTMLEHLVVRLKSVEVIDEIILATTLNSLDDILKQEAQRLNIKIYRGDEENVMKRVILAAEMAAADIVVETTADCPILDPKIVQRSIDIFKVSSCDYVSNIMPATYPDGMAVQVFGLATLRKSYGLTKDRLDLEHVSLHMRNNPNLFSQVNFTAPPNMYWPGLGLTLDEKLDFDLIDKIIQEFGITDETFSCEQVVRFLKSNPSLIVNNSVLRKGNS